MKPQSASKKLFNALRDQPDQIVKWAEAEIYEYKQLIALIKRDINKRNKERKIV